MYARLDGSRELILSLAATDGAWPEVVERAATLG